MITKNTNITKQSVTGPSMTLRITNEERDAATQIKQESKEILKDLNNAVDMIVKLKNAIVEQRPQKQDLKVKYHGRFLRYRRKINDAFNKFLNGIRKSLEKISKISDPGMIRLRDILIAEVGELSDGAESIMDILADPDKENFTKSIEFITSQMEKRKKSIIDVIDNQLLNHIDHDIFGKMKISKMRFNIKRRARILKQYVVQNKVI